MALKLIEAQARWQAMNAPHLVALVRAGAAPNRPRHNFRHAAAGGSDRA